MTINARGYLDHLKVYLNTACYGKTCQASEARGIGEKQLVLSEKVEGTRRRRKVTLEFDDDAFAIKLDQGNDPLFHFLTNGDGHLWSRRCDFVVFERRGERLHAHCIEFKEASTRIPVDNIFLQLRAAEAWCRSLHKILGVYVDEAKRINLSCYVFTGCQNPAPDLDDTGKYLRKHPSIRHYLFDEADGMNLKDLENSTVKVIQ